MRDGKTDFFGNVDRGQQRPLLVAGWAGGYRRAAIVGCLQENATNRSPSFAGSVLAVRVANSGKSFLQIATLEKGGQRPRGLGELLLDLVDQLLAFGFPVGGAAFVVLEVAEGGGGVGLGAA